MRMSKRGVSHIRNLKVCSSQPRVCVKLNVAAYAKPFAASAVTYGGTTAAR